MRPGMSSVGENLLCGTLASGANATGHAIGGLGDNQCADWIVLDTDASQFAGVTAHDAVDRWIFSGNRNLVRDVHVAGRQVVAEGQHRDRDAIALRYRAAIESLSG